MIIKIILILLLTLLKGARAEKSSGAIIWWVFFVIIWLIMSSAYLFYVVYIVKKPLGTGHINYAGKEEDLAQNRPRAESNKDRAKKYAHEDNPNMAAGNNIVVANKPDVKNLTKAESQILELMTKVKQETEPMQGGEFQVHLDADDENDIEVMKKAKKIKFPDYRLLSIWNTDKFVNENNDDLIDFLSNTTPKKIKYFAMHSSSFIDITLLQKPLK